MSAVEITIDFSQVVEMLGGMKQMIPPAITATLDRVENEMIRDAQQIVPVKTGNLRSSIGRKGRTVDSTTIGPKAEYGGYVENGTRNMSARPYMDPAMREVVPQIPEWFTEEYTNRIA